MAHVYDEEAVIRVWRNVKTFRIIPTSHFGHAAITVRGGTVPGRKVYISWWPGDGGAGLGDAFKAMRGTTTGSYSGDKRSEMNLLTALRLEVGYRRREGIPYPPEWCLLLADEGKTALNTPRPGQTRLDQLTRVEGVDLPVWSQSADDKVNVPGLGARDQLWGLGLAYMCDWWTEFVHSDGEYRLASRTNSCAGAAAQALHAGGAEAFVPAPFALIYMEPVMILEWATALATRVEQLNRGTTDLLREFNDLRKAGKVTLLDPKDEMHDGLWSLACWKKRSAVDFAMRSAVIKDIDTALGKYHGYTWHQNFPEKYTALADIMSNCLKHHASKPDSKRAAPVLRLASQVGLVLAKPRANGGRFPSGTGALL